MGVTAGEGNGYAHPAQEGTDVRTLAHALCLPWIGCRRVIAGLSGGRV